MPRYAQHVSTVVRLVDLAVVDNIVQDQLFKNCLILGPAVVHPMGGLRMASSTLGATDINHLLWRVAPDAPVPVGAIQLIDCSFEFCRFIDVGFVATPAMLEGLQGDDALLADDPDPEREGQR